MHRKLDRQFEALMKFCQKCYKEFPTEGQAARHEARCRCKTKSTTGLMENIQVELDHVAELDSLRNISGLRSLPIEFDLKSRGHARKS